MTPSPTALLLHVRDSRPHAPGFQRELDTLTEATERAVAALGWRPERIAAAEVASDELLRRARAADAVVVLGGEDVDPTLYGGSRDYPGAGTHEPVADRATMAVIRDAVGRGSPLLAICRGHQLLNVALGGTLVQHLDGHHSAVGDPFVQTQVRAFGDSAVGTVALAGPVLCTHHQAIRDLAPGLEVLVRAADGVIEAVAHETAPVVGVQWHPEHPRTAVEQVGALLQHLAALAGAPAG